MALNAMFHFSTFDSTRVRSLFNPRKPRNPLLRVALGLVGLALLALLLVFGAVVGAGMIVAGLLYRLWKPRAKPVAGAVASDRAALDGEYRVLGKIA